MLRYSLWGSDPLRCVTGVSAACRVAQHKGCRMIQASLRIVAPPGKRAEVLDVLRCLKGPTEVSRGCRVCSVLQDVEDERVLTYLVQWDTQDDLEEHFRSERFRRLLPYIELSVEPPEIDVSTIDQIGGIEVLRGRTWLEIELVTTGLFYTKEKRMKRVMLTVAMMAWGLASAIGAETDRQAEDEAAIRKAVESYVAAFNQGDAKALAAMWSPEAVYTNPLSGEQVVGREEIEKQFAAHLCRGERHQAGGEDEIPSNSSRRTSPSNRERPRSFVRIKQPEESEYTAVYVKRDGQWLLDRVTEEDVPVVPSHYEQLKELEWMIGTWVDQDEQNRIETTCQWTKNRNFMTRSFTVSVRDRIEMAGMQIVGWDPAAKQIRSWVFDSDGGFGEGVWSKKDKRWYVQATGTLPDGSKTSSVNIITYVDDNTFTWQSVNREAGGEILPNVDEVVVVREQTKNRALS